MLKEFHHKKTKNEFCVLRKSKCDYIKPFDSLPFYTETDPRVIPAVWKSKTLVT
jgi:hypothetical protein